MKKKVLVITGSFPPDIGGIQNYVYNLCKYSNHDITVMAPHYEMDEQFDRAQDITIVRRDFLKKNFFVTGFNLLVSVNRLLKTNNFDLIICNHVLVATIGRVISFFTKKPFLIITYGKDTLEFLNNWILKWLVITNLQKAHGIITCSEYTKGEVIKLGISSRKVLTVLPGVETKFKPLPKSKELIKHHNLIDKKILYTIGRLVERKGHDMVIRSLPYIIKNIPDIVYLIVGDGEYKDKLESLVKEYQVEEHVVFTGKVEDSALVDYYNLGDVFIMPSRFVENTGSVEGFGIVYLEASACKKVVIGGDSGGAPEAVGDETTGVLLDPTNPVEIAEKVIQLFSNEEKANSIAENAYLRSINQFTYDKLCKKFDNIIVDISNKSV